MSAVLVIGTVLAVVSLGVVLYYRLKPSPLLDSLAFRFSVVSLFAALVIGFIAVTAGEASGMSALEVASVLAVMILLILPVPLILIANPRLRREEDGE